MMLDPPQLFAGFFAAIGLYNALVFAVTRDKPFAWYAGLTASMVFIQGLFEPALYGPEGTTPHTILRAAILVAYFLCAVGFVRSYLRLAEEQPRIDRALNALLMMNVAGVLFEDWLPRVPLHLLADDLLLYGMLLTSLWAGVTAMSRGREGAAYFVLAFAGALFGLAVNDVGEDLRLHGTFEYAFQAGVAWEALFLALALASRVRFASYDRLTGVRNRRGFDDALAAAWREAVRSGGVLSLIMIDVNGFKGYNDEMGHPAGDALLRRIALLCAGCCRGRADVFARYGGDEFAAILPGAAEDEARAVARRMQSVVAQDSPVTISTGVACLRGADLNFAQLLEHADAALYRDKRAYQYAGGA